MAGEPQKPAAPPPPAGASFWRRVAQLAGVDDEIDAVSAAVIAAQNWAQSKLPPPAALPTIAADLQARQAALDQRKQQQWDAISAPVSRFFGSAPVQQAGRHLKEKYYDVPADVQGLSERLQSTVTERGDTRRAELEAAGLSALDPMFALRDEWLPNLAIGTAADSTSAFGAASNLDLPIGPAAKAVGGVASHAGMLPGFFSRVERVAAKVPAKGIHPNKLLSELRSGASQEEILYRKINDLIAGKGNQLITKAELDAHLAAHPAPEIGQTVLGGPNPARLSTLPPGHSIQPLATDPLTQGGQEYAWVDPSGVGRRLHSSSPEDAAQFALDILNRERPRTLPTRHGSYTLPGGENYREALTTLPVEQQKQGMYRAHITRPSDGRTTWKSDDSGGFVSGSQLNRLRSEYEPKGYTVHAEEVPTPAPAYQSTHWDQPNVLLHTRSNERTLAPAPMRSIPEIERIVQDVVGAQFPEHIAWNGPHQAVRQGLISYDEAALYGQSRGFTNYPHAPTGPRGRFIEEVQSDLHKQGEKEGYQPPGARRAVNETRARLDEVDAQLRAYRSRFDAEYTAAHPPDPLSYEQWLADEILPAYRGPEHDATNRRVYNSDITQGKHSAQNRLARERADAYYGDPTAQALADQQRDAQLAHDQARIAASTGVPDVPFKDTWPDLALKQQLLDAAHRQDLDWLGLSGAQTHVDRYGTERLTWVPEGRGFRVKWEPQVGGDALGGDQDIGQAALARGLIENTDAYVETPEQLDALLGYGSDLKLEKAWKRIQASPEGGTYLPRKEGMEAFYDRALPAKLQRLLKPFGGTVERGAVPVQKDVVIPNGREVFYVTDEEGARITPYYATEAAAENYIRTGNQGEWPEEFSMASMRRDLPTTQTVDEPAWIARLSPEMKERIRQQGFPLMSFVPPVAVGAGAAAAASASGEEGEGSGLTAGLMAAAPFLPGVGGDLAGLARRERQGLRAFHGSPHDFDRFDLSKLGTGEGAQAFGHGLYFAENEGVARDYRNRLARGILVNKEPPPDPLRKALEFVDANVLRTEGPERALQHAIARMEEQSKFYRSAYMVPEDTSENLYDLAAKRLRTVDPASLSQPGKMYEVNLDVDPQHLLNWDRPIAEQSRLVQNAVVPHLRDLDQHMKAERARQLARGTDAFGKPFKADRLARLQAMVPDPIDRPGSDAYRMMGFAPGDAPLNQEVGYQRSSEALRKLGIPGLSYLDGASRGAGTGTRNYVMFDDARVDILRKYGFLPPLAGAAAAAQFGQFNAPDPAAPPVPPLTPPDRDSPY